MIQMKAEDYLLAISKWVLPVYIHNDRQLVNLSDANAMKNYAKLALEELKSEEEKEE